MITVIKNNNNNKRQRRKKTREKKRTSDETRPWDLYFNTTVLPQGHEGSLEIILQKALI